jgi:hypothetical protein
MPDSFDKYSREQHVPNGYTKITIPLVILGFVISGKAAGTVTKQQLFRILARDGISNSLKPRTKISSMGRVFLKGHWYSFFYYDHVTPSSQHGTYRILILNDKQIYVGGFNVDDGVNCRIRAARITCDDDNNEPFTLIDFRSKYVVRHITTGKADENFWK